MKVFFDNSDGEQLSAVLDLPVNQSAKAFVLFAHCFTCSKDLRAVRNISSSLTGNGFGVLRFDFTGLGESEGEFADTNFSSNIEDLLCADDFLTKEYQAPSMIVGHSLGGAAAYFAASRLDSVQAVASIGAPSDPKHVNHLFADSTEEIKKEGHAQVQLSGRPFTIKKQFLEDISEKNLKDLLEDFRKPILILHSPQDETVEIENARKIYNAAWHPKSFISLNGADHLLSNKDDSIYVGDVIASWANRYVDIPDQQKLKLEKQVAVRIGKDGYTTEILAGKHHLRADEPEEVGGNDFGPTPYDLLLSSLGACTAMTLRMYADRKQWAVDEINVHLSYNKEYIEDCENPDNPKAIIDKIERSIQIDGSLDEKQEKRMLEIADKCPVHKTLHGDIRVETMLNQS